MYVGMALSYVGLAVTIGSWWALVLLPIVLLVMTIYVIRREERHLAARFGEEYAEYRRRVRRWL
jgi:protein-S-isoprenylcysteine O-methyltransferase Ste14